MIHYKEENIKYLNLKLKTIYCKEEPCCKHCQKDPGLSEVMILELDKDEIVGKYIVCNECFLNCMKLEEEKHLFGMECCSL